MSAHDDSSVLSRRDREILKDVVRTFILSGDPVSSRSVAKNRRHGVSAATIRNTMADLEEEGYLRQPHASAGRVPTAAGYHFYVDSLMPARRLSAHQRGYIDESLHEVIETGGDPVATAGHLLSELSHQVGVVLTPNMGETVLRAIEFLPLSGDRVLCVLVSTSGFVDQKVVRAGSVPAREDLVRISNYLTENFAGLTLRQIRARLVRSMSAERAQVDHLLSNALALARQALESGDQDVVVEGTAGLLGQPELGNIDQVRRLLDTFDEKARLVELLGKVIEGRGVRVLIGDDTDLTSELDFSLVATTYAVGGRALGSLGVFGPSRMEYRYAIPLVNYLGETLGRALEEVDGEAPDDE
ncbi:MAG: heat-inducible transcriptional repressor HrcA [Thermoanaerobaculia bacterium]|nr:heat-inducible transcriptional repressor HrcA [Thermoanaerobaculia bacterium]